MYVIPKQAEVADCPTITHSTRVCSVLGQEVMYALSMTKWSSHDHSLYLAPIWPSLLLTCTACVCEYPTHTHPPTPPLPGLITDHDSFGKTMEQGGSLEGGQAGLRLALCYF